MFYNRSINRIGLAYFKTLNLYKFYAKHSSKKLFKTIMIKGQAQAKIIKKTVILFRLLNMTI